MLDFGPGELKGLGARVRFGPLRGAIRSPRMPLKTGALSRFSAVMARPDDRSDRRNSFPWRRDWIKIKCAKTDTFPIIMPPS